MEGLEGVTLVRRGAYAAEPVLGGFSTGQIACTIDGMKIFVSDLNPLRFYKMYLAIF